MLNRFVSLPVSFITLVVCLAVGCSSSPKTVQGTVTPGMDKDQVLTLLGNPSRSKRISGADRWSYDQHLDGQKTTVHVYFKDGKVSFVGADEDFEKSLRKTAEEKKKTEDGKFREME